MNDIKIEQPIEIEGHRTVKGLTITVKVHPVVEEFFQIASGGDTVAVGTQGRSWIKSGDFDIYELPATLQRLSLIGAGTYFSLAEPGRPLARIDSSGARVVNVSFLRLVGIAEGVTFRVSGVFSEDEVDWIITNSLTAAQSIYAQYIKPLAVSASLIDDLPSKKISRETDLRQPQADVITF